MSNCKQKLRTKVTLRRSAGMCLLFATCLPLMAGCIHFFYEAGVKRFSLPEKALKIIAATHPASTSNPNTMNQSGWLKLPAKPESFSAEKLEIEIIRLTNKLRKDNNREPLVHRPVLDEVARRHSHEMANLNYFSHQSPVKSNRTAEMRLRNSGADYSVLAENIAKEPLVRSFWSDGRIEYYTWADVAQNTVRHWFTSIGHRRNMLMPDIEEIGVGAQLGGLDTPTPFVYVTQTLRRP